MDVRKTMRSIVNARQNEVSMSILEMSLQDTLRYEFTIDKGALKPLTAK